MVTDTFADTDEIMPTQITVNEGTGYVLLSMKCGKESVWADLGVDKARRLIEALEQAISKADK